MWPRKKKVNLGVGPGKSCVSALCSDQHNPSVHNLILCTVSFLASPLCTSTQGALALISVSAILRWPLLSHPLGCLICPCLSRGYILAVIWASQETSASHSRVPLSTRRLELKACLLCSCLAECEEVAACEFPARAVVGTDLLACVREHESWGSVWVQKCVCSGRALCVRVHSERGCACLRCERVPMCAARLCASLCSKNVCGGIERKELTQVELH